MPRHYKTRQQEPENKQKRTSTRSNPAAFSQLQTRNPALDETPFFPQTRQHVKSFLEAVSSEDRANIMEGLQQAYGNRYVQSLVESIRQHCTGQQGSIPDAGAVADAVTRTMAGKTGTPAGTGLMALQEEEEYEMMALQEEEEEEEMQMTPSLSTSLDALAALVGTEPPTQEEETEAVMASQPSRNIQSGDASKLNDPSPADARKGTSIPVLTLPDPATMGGVVTVRGGSFVAWINPGEPACVRGGIEAHEAKHISDFEADATYRQIPTNGSIQEGHCVYYLAPGDARRFEHPACDVEIAWLREQLANEGLSAADRRTVTNRITVVQAYKASF